MRTVLLAALVTVSCASLRADFSYQESSKMTGGTVYNLLRAGGPFTRKAREAQISTVAIQGNKMVRTDKDSASITDLDKEEFIEIDFSKKQYTVVTFAQLKAAMEKALADAQKEQAKENKGKAQETNTEMNFKVSVKATGKTETISGLSAKELVVSMEAQVKDKESGQTGAMNVVSDGWMANVPGYDQVKAFQLKMAQKMGTLFDPAQAQLAMAQPQMVSGMAVAAKEMAKVDGVPVRTIVKIGTGPTEELMKTGSGGEEKSEGKSVTKTAAASAVAGAIGGFGGFGRKKEAKPKEEAPAADTPQAVLLTEMTLEMSMFSTSGVDSAKFAVPAGFKLVDSEISKQAKKK